MTDHSLGLSVRDVSVQYQSSPRTRTRKRERERERLKPTAPVLQQVSFEVARGEVVALTGPSGCGKSTLLRAICGLEPLTTGVVQWDGQDLAAVAPHRRGFGLMFQDGQLFAHMNVAKNIAYGLNARTSTPAATPTSFCGHRRAFKSARNHRIAELLQLVGLPGFEHRAVTELSGGERQRVALARSLAAQPKLLLLDEPLSALDRELRDRLAVELVTILRVSGTSAIVVTHDHAEARAIADRVLRLQYGQLKTI